MVNIFIRNYIKKDITRICAFGVVFEVIFSGEHIQKF